MPETKKKTIVINASTVMFGGGLIVAIDIIQSLHKTSKYHLHLICPNIKIFQNLSPEIKKNYTPRLFFTFYFRFILDFVRIPNKINSINPDLVITLGNLPARTHYRQLMLNDNAFVSQRKLSAIPLTLKDHIKNYIRKKLFWQRLTFVNLLVVQTSTEKKRLLEFNIPTPEIVCLPPLLPYHLTGYSKQNISLPNKKNGTIRLVCASNYFPHKNISILKEVLELASKENFPLQIIFMLDARKIKEGKIFIKNLAPLVEKENAINVGFQSPKKIVSIIKQCDGVISPSLLETFGLNCVEAWYCKKPYFVSNLPWAHEVCGDAAIYINPINAKEILDKIKTAFFNPEKLTGIIKSGVKKLDHWPDSSKLLLEVEKCLTK